jgi:hypothetical protein
MYSSIAEATLSPAFTVDIANIIVSVILTIGAMAGAVMLPEAVIPVALGAGILGTSMAVGGSLSIFVGTGYL